MCLIFIYYNNKYFNFIYIYLERNVKLRVSSKCYLKIIIIIYQKLWNKVMQSNI